MIYACLRFIAGMGAAAHARQLRPASARPRASTLATALAAIARRRDARRRRRPLRRSCSRCSRWASRVARAAPQRRARATSTLQSGDRHRRAAHRAEVDGHVGRVVQHARVLPWRVGRGAARWSRLALHRRWRSRVPVAAGRRGPRAGRRRRWLARRRRASRRAASPSAGSSSPRRSTRRTSTTRRCPEVSATPGRRLGDHAVRGEAIDLAVGSSPHSRSTSRVCWPSSGAGRSTRVGVSEKCTGQPSALRRPRFRMDEIDHHAARQRLRMRQCLAERMHRPAGTPAASRLAIHSARVR